MTEQTAPANPTTNAQRQHEALWNQFRADVAAVTEAHPGPDPVARLLWEAITLAFEAGAVRAGAAALVGQRLPRMPDARIIGHVLGYAKTAGSDPRVAALHQLTHARTAVTAAAPTIPEDGGNCDG